MKSCYIWLSNITNQKAFWIMTIASAILPQQALASHVVPLPLWVLWLPTYAPMSRQGRLLTWDLVTTALIALVVRCNSPCLRARSNVLLHGITTTNTGGAQGIQDQHHQYCKDHHIHKEDHHLHQVHHLKLPSKNYGIVFSQCRDSGWEMMPTFNRSYDLRWALLNLINSF